MLVVQPSQLHPPERLANWLVDAGAELRTLECGDEALPADLTGYDGMVVLDGSMGASDDLLHPWLADLRKLLSTGLTNRVPILAIGLGAQLLAVVGGGRIREMKRGPETGPGLVAKRDSAADDPLFGPLPLTPDILSFHSDEIAVLPPTALLLASSPRCDHQLFRIGTCAYGMQFHIGTTTDTVLRWVESMPEVAATRTGGVARERLDEFHAEASETWQPVAERFVRMAILPPEERTAQRQLPVV